MNFFLVNFEKEGKNLPNYIDTYKSFLTNFYPQSPIIVISLAEAQKLRFSKPVWFLNTHDSRICSPSYLNFLTSQLQTSFILGDRREKYPEGIFHTEFNLSLLKNNLLTWIDYSGCSWNSLDSFGQFLPCLFLDRDGILIEDKNYLCDWNEANLNYSFISFLQYLKKYCPYLFIGIITNQSGIDRKFFTHEQLIFFHQNLQKAFFKFNLSFDFIESCPSYDNSHYERKPNPGMILNVLKKIPIKLESSFMIGDKTSDKILLKGLSFFLFPSL